MLTTPPEPRECLATRPHLSGGGREPAASARDGQAELIKADGPRRAIALFYDLRLLVRHALRRLATPGGTAASRERCASRIRRRRRRPSRCCFAGASDSWFATRLSANSQVVGCITSNLANSHPEMGPHNQNQRMRPLRLPQPGSATQYSDSLPRFRQSRGTSGRVRKRPSNCVLLTTGGC